MKTKILTRITSFALAVATACTMVTAVSAADEPKNLALGKEIVSHDEINDDGWRAANLTDGKRVSEQGRSGYSSNAAYNEDKLDCDAAFILDLDDSIEFNKIVMYPRTDALRKDSEDGAANFPRNFRIEVADELGEDGKSLVDSKTVVAKEDVETDINTPIAYEFDRVKGQYVMLYVTRVGLPDGGNEGRLQLAEFEIYNVNTQADIDKAAADAVIALIDKLDGNSPAADVKAAREAYNKLTDAQKALVTDMTRLEAAEKKIADTAAVNEIIGLINALGANPTADAVEYARKGYDALRADLQAQVTNLNLLEAAEKKLASVGKDQDNKKPAASKKASVKKITIKQGKKTVKKITIKLKKKTIRLKAVVTGKNLTKAYKKISWTTSKKKIATVSSKGVVKLKKKGTVKITAKNKKSGKKATVTIKVK